MHGTLRPFPVTVVRAALALTIVIGSLITWIGIPLLWIWIITQFSDDYPAIYMAALAGCPLTMIIWGWTLYRLNTIYIELAPPPEEAPGVQRSAWLTSMSGDRRPLRRAATLLDVSMIVSVIIALIAMAVWFFAFAHTSGPLPE